MSYILYTLLVYSTLVLRSGTIRATVMIETLPACFDMEEMLYQLKDYACGMNAGRWDYIFSLIKVLKSRSDCVLPDRKQVSFQNTHKIGNSFQSPRFLEKL